MVEDPRAAARADALRPLNRPQPITILVRNDLPDVLIDDARRYRITQIQDSWRIDDEWWRQPISRHYYRLVLDDGQLRTVYHDLITDRWYTQPY